MRTALITGATAGFGYACAKTLSTAGYRIIICGRREERLKSLETELNSLEKVKTLSFDIMDKEKTIEAINSLPNDWSDIDILINNAGLALGKSFIESGESRDWEIMLDTNVKGLLYITQALLPRIKNSANGHIINIGSIAGTEVYPGGNVYCASKHAVNALSKAMRIELLSYGIRVSQIRPGLADTEFSLVRYKGDSQKAQQVYSGFEALIAEDIARCVLFAIESPQHVCINDLEVTPTAQANAYLLQKS